MTVNYLKSLVAEANKAWENYEASEAANLSEEETDITYAAYHSVAEKLAKALVEGTAGMINITAASRMAHHKRDQIMAIAV